MLPVVALLVLTLEHDRRLTPAERLGIAAWSGVTAEQYDALLQALRTHPAAQRRYPVLRRRSAATGTPASSEQDRAANGSAAPGVQ
jgi:hypothetical protein